MDEDTANSQGQTNHPSGDMMVFSSSDDDDDGEESNPHHSAARIMAINAISQTQQTAAYPMLFDSSSSSSEDSDGERPWGGSVPGKAPNKARNFQLAKATLMRQYFNGEDSIFDEFDFERRFRMPRAVFMKVKDAVIGEGPFTQRFDGSGKPGIDPLVRLTACFRRLAYGTSSDLADEQFEVSESVISRDLPIMCRIVKEKLGSYINSMPNEEVMAQVQGVNAGRGFPGLLASWDCKHFPWEICPVAQQGQYKSGAKPSPSLILEAICDPHLYIWYHHFGEPGSLNDINVLHKSSIFLSILSGQLDLETQPYQINNAVRNFGYFLVDGIYPSWAIFIDTFHEPQDEKQILFCQAQEGVRKDIERAFGVIVKKWRMLQQPLRNWYIDDIKSILDCCIIFHNMVVEHKRNNYTINDWVRNQVELYNLNNNENLAHLSLFGTNNLGNVDPSVLGPGLAHLRGAAVSSVYDDPVKHFSLKSDLVEHIWNLKKN